MTQKNTQREIIRAQHKQQARKRTISLVIGVLILVAAFLLVYFLPRLLNASKI